MEFFKNVKIETESGNTVEAQLAFWITAFMACQPKDVQLRVINMVEQMQAEADARRISSPSLVTQVHTPLHYVMKADPGIYNFKGDPKANGGQK